MTRKSLTWMLIAVAATVWFACARSEKAAQGEAPTIAAPDPKPEETGTDAMTQTVSIEDSRSEAEGGVLTSPNPPIRTRGGAPPETSTTTTTTTTTSTTGTTTTARPRP